MSWQAVLLCVVVGGSVCRAESFLNNISRNLRSEMSGVWEMSHVNYSKANIVAVYEARLEFDMRAMGPLYNSTKIVIDAIAKKDAYPQDFVSVSDGFVEIAPLNENWRPLLAHYAGPAAVIIVAALLVVVLPLAGLFWCCCYWCRAGRRRRPFDRKYDACLKGLLAIILIALLTLFLFGVVCAFATEEQLEHSAQEAPASFVAGVDDVCTFLNATQAHARWLLVVNFRELEKKLDAMLTSSGMTVSMQLGEFSRAVSVTALNGMVQRLDGVAADLREVHRLTGALRSNAEHLNSGLRKVKARLLQTLARCEQPQCIRLQEKYKIGQLDTEIQYSQMPDVTELLSNVTALLESNIKADVAEGQKVFTDIQRAIQRSVDENIPAIQDSIHETGRRLEGVSENISAMAGNASAALKRGRARVGALERAHRNYGPYRRYAGLAAAAALLTITCLLAWGLMCGVCGKRPDVYGAGDCCNKAAGSKCLLCGMGVMFLAGGGAALVMLVYFAVGIGGQRFICDPLTEPADNRLFYDVDQFLDFEKMLFDENEDPNFNITSVLTACHQNLTIYKVLHLHRLYDIEKIQLEVNAEVGRRVAALRPAFPTGARALSILKPSAKLKLRQLADTGLSEFDFDRILHALETNVTSLSLDGLSAQLESTARTLATRAGFASVAEELRDAAGMLADYHANVVRSLLNDTARLNTTALKLRDGLRFNHSSLKEAVSYLMYETTQAEHFLNTQGPDVIQNMTREFAEVVAAMLEEYLQHVLAAAQHDVGRCGPLSNALNVSRDAFCHKILMPTNGYWMSLAWCLMLFVPIMVVAQRLARLYLHVDPYPGPLVEAEYLYDAYADRDNVPLANGSKRSTLDIEGKIAEWRGRAAPSAPPAPPPHGSAPPHSRTQLLLDGEEVVCQLVPPPAALIDDLKTRLDAKDEDNESGIHESE